MIAIEHIYADQMLIKWMIIMAIAAGLTLAVWK
jgi:hypothetical protein